ncbi:hypothetical protein ACIQXV_22385 [Neobacillus sp. NPDC097160]|uniref:hypothetical protein n=1 Tax=Neobacillus sp. NPDC097160 TaxID=3364298 RepID=UPI0037FBE056
MTNRVAATVYLFLLELIAGLLFLFFFYISKKDLPPIFLLVALCISSMILFTLLLTKFHEKGKWLYLVSVFPLLLVIGHMTGLSLFMGIGLGLIVFWRGISLFDDASKHSEASLLLVSFLISLFAIIYSAMSRYPFQSVIIFLLTFQIGITLTGIFFRKLYSIQADKSKFALYFFKILAAITTVGVMFTILLKYILFLFFSILDFTVFLLTKIAEPLFSLLQYLLSLGGNEGRKTNVKNGSGLLDYEDKYHAPNYDQTENILYILLIMGAVSFIIYLFYKKKIKPQSFTIDTPLVISVSEGVFGVKNLTKSRRKIKPPEDVIRREIFELEKYAHKLKLGRLPFETLEEWWKRVGLTVSLDSIGIYEKVRYGGIIASNKEQTLIKTEIRYLKQQLKEIKNNQKEKQ